MKILCTIIVIMFLATNTFATVYFSDDLNYADATAFAAEWGVESEASLESSGCKTNKCAKITYSGSWSQLTNTGVSSAGGEFYMGFWSKVTNKSNQWAKFLKFFGTGFNTTYSNMTFSNGGYTSVGLQRFSHGGNSYPAGDTTCINRFDGYTNCTGTASTTGSEFTFPDENWHKFVLHVKLNTNGNADGIWEVWIDDVLTSSWSGVVNRADANTRSFAYFSFGDYTTGTPSQTWYLWYDDVVIASTYDEANGGEGDTTAPSVTISTTDPSTITSDSLSISGTASDAVGVSGCKYRIGSAPNASNGTALTGTTSWSGTATGFSSGANTLYVGCYDAAGNYGTDTMSVTYNPPSSTGSLRPGVSASGVTFR